MQETQAAVIAALKYAPAATQNFSHRTQMNTHDDLLAWSGILMRY